MRPSVHGKRTHPEAIDSAPVKANASMDTLKLKVPQEELSAHLQKIRHNSKRDKDTPVRKARNNKVDESQKGLSASKKELQAIEGRNKKWSDEQDPHRRRSLALPTTATSTSATTNASIVRRDAI